MMRGPLPMESVRPNQIRIYEAGHIPRFREEWAEIIASGHLLWSLVHRDLTIRYRRSVLGFFWTMLHPLLLTIILTVVFSSVFRFSLPHYEIYVLTGLLPWNFFSQTTSVSMAGMAWNGPLMKRVRVPKSIFTLSTVLSGLVNLALSYVPLIAIMLFRGVPIRPALLFLPVAVLIFALFVYGLSLLLSAVSVYFVDVREMYTVVLTALLYLTPVIYPRSIIPAKYAALIDWNPMSLFIDLVRVPVHDGVLPETRLILIAAGTAVLSFLIGWDVFRRLSRGFYSHL
jgi:ABC-2 type transport system permease protein